MAYIHKSYEVLKDLTADSNKTHTGGNSNIDHPRAGKTWPV
jgi:hypothetical protein